MSEECIWNSNSQLNIVEVEEKNKFLTFVKEEDLITKPELEELKKKLPQINEVKIQQTQQLQQKNNVNKKILYDNEYYDFTTDATKDISNLPTKFIDALNKFKTNQKDINWLITNGYTLKSIKFSLEIKENLLWLHMCIFGENPAKGGKSIVARKGSYEAMTVKELKERAVKRKIKGYSGMKKSQLIAALRKK